ncbi:MAG: hypothetical protein HZC24_12420 [Rhodocyclales bacterium]|nr:hypothetical protein [Rhodocyclales bacterium]
MATTADALDGLLAVRDGDLTARWNYPAAVGTAKTSPGGTGTNVSLSYSFLTALPSYSSEYPSAVTGFEAFNEAGWGMCTAARTALQKIGEVIGVTFTEAAAGTVGQLTFAMNAQSGSSGYAYLPSYATTWDQGGTILSVGEQATSGDVWMTNTPNVAWTAAAFQVGGFGYETLIHEIGHALGLKHPFEGGTTLDAAHDTAAFTVMSYTAAPRSVVVTTGSSATNYTYRNQSASSLMLGDIRALQYLYGANAAGRSGNDTYQWTDRETFFATIWDGGGTDILDCSNQTLDCVIDLTPGSYSSIGLRRTEAELLAGTPTVTLADITGWWGSSVAGNLYNGSNNLAIADNVVIETVRGGSAADAITGNGAANLIEGGNGVDTLTGGLGNDTLDGGAGSDTVTYAGARADYAVRRAAGGYAVTDNVTAGGDEGTDALANVETLQFTGQTLALAADAAPTGSIGIVGTATRDQTLTASSSLADADGLGTLSYQWQADGSDVAGATGASLLLTQSLVGKQIRVLASYTDGLGIIESATSAATAAVADVSGTGKTVGVQAYAWKSHSLLAGVALDAGHSTGSNGGVNYSGVTGNTLSMTPTLTADAATTSAVNLQDAIAILKMIVGLDVNGAGKPLSPYQALAADFDASGSVNLTDAIGVLKHVVGLTAPNPAWVFADEANPNIPAMAAGLTDKALPPVAADVTSDTSVGLVAILRGDVDASWAAPAGSQTLDAAHFQDLVATHTGLSLSQFGIYA